MELKLNIHCMKRRWEDQKITRRKQQQELEGGTKISKHGVQIHCTYCGGCKKRKADLNGKKLPVKRSRESPHGGEEPDITQVEYNIIIQYPIQVIIELTFNC